jgi:hypothetical protein
MIILVAYYTNDECMLAVSALKLGCNFIFLKPRSVLERGARKMHCVDASRYRVER